MVAAAWLLQRFMCPRRSAARWRAWDVAGNAPAVEAGERQRIEWELVCNLRSMAMGAQSGRLGEPVKARQPVIFGVRSRDRPPHDAESGIWSRSHNCYPGLSAFPLHFSTYPSSTSASTTAAYYR